MFDPIKKLNIYESLRRELEKAPSLCAVSGCMESQKAQLAAGLGKNRNWTLYVCRDDREMTETAADLRTFCGNVWSYPARDLLFGNADVHGGYIENSRTEALHHRLKDERGILVAPADALMDVVAAAETFEKNILRISEGDLLNLRETEGKLRELGYEPVPEVEGMGQFAVRGGILDIFPFTAENACRVELYGDEVDTIRTIDTESQRSVERLKQLEIVPSAGLRAGKTRTNLLDYFEDESLVVLDEPLRTAERLRGLEEEFVQGLERRKEAGIEEQGISKEDVFSAGEVLERLGSLRCVMLSALPQLPEELKNACSFHIRTAAVGSYKGSFDLMIEELKRFRDQKYIVTVVTPSRTRTGRLAESLREYGIHAFCPAGSEDVQAQEERQERQKSLPSDRYRLATEAGPGEAEVVCGSLRHGFIYPELHYVLITEGDMFGKTKENLRRRRKYEGEKLSSLNELSVGDYVVHESHGIGIYRGLEHIVQDGNGRDYIKIEYAEGDNLYLPATKLELVQKFASSEAARPRLNRLNGTEWQKTKAKVKRAVDDMAKELTELYARRSRPDGFRYGEDTVWQREFEETFPYEETEDQLKAIESVKADMQSSRIMDRLICGDVGFGKTEVALRAAFKAVQEGRQTAFLVPTTILCEQHFRTFTDRMRGYPVRIGMLSRFNSPQENKEIVKDVADGRIDIVIGTHRMLSKDVSFHSLGLLVIDEEQRFGVRHKEQIKQLKTNVDVLSMSATPIPRTLHMSLSGIRDLSLLREPPMERVPVQTYVMEYNDELVREAALREAARGGQVFYVYNRVKDIEEKAGALRALLPDLRIEYAHGQMPENELEEIMHDFVDGNIDMLVSTTIIETGLDIPNANTLIIDGAEKMGLSSLYQIRGRVGRSDRTAYAFFMYKKDRILSEEAEKRLRAIREFAELGAGIRIAMRDLEIRGAGNVLGAEQHGQMAAVGYEMYVRLLEEAVHSLQSGKPEAPAFETTVDCAFDAFLPGTYVRDERQRLDLYKRIAMVKDEESSMDMIDELSDRFGDPPREALNLIRTAKLRALASKACVTELSIRKDGFRMSMYPRAVIKVEEIPKAMEEEEGRLRFQRGQQPRFIYEDRRAHGDGAFAFDKAEKLILRLTPEEAKI